MYVKNVERGRLARRGQGRAEPSRCGPPKGKAKTTTRKTNYCKWTRVWFRKKMSTSDKAAKTQSGGNTVWQGQRMQPKCNSRWTELNWTAMGWTKQNSELTAQLSCEGSVAMNAACSSCSCSWGYCIQILKYLARRWHLCVEPHKKHNMQGWMRMRMNTNASVMCKLPELVQVNSMLSGC